jgi:hypothetical protein
MQGVRGEKVLCRLGIGGVPTAPTTTHAMLDLLEREIEATDVD